MPPKRKAQTTKMSTAPAIKKTRATKKSATATTKIKTSHSLTQSAFSPKLCKEWFNRYKDPESEDDLITPEGCQRFFNDLGISLESVDLILICWKINASRLSYFTRSEWDQGMKQLNVDTPDKLKAILPQLQKSIADEDAFKKMYVYAFSFAKSDGQKSMEVEVATALWHMLLGPKYSHIQSFCDYLHKKKPVKVINKDQWSSLLDFCKSVPEDFEEYDSTSSWPVLFDEYVEWRKMELDEV